MKLTKEQLELLRDESKVKRVEWTITLTGVGKTNEEAWEQMLEGFFCDPGVADEEDVVLVEEEED